MTLTEIETELPKLTLEERAELARKLEALNGDAWDEQIRKDVRAGRLDFLFDEADAAYARGETEEWP